MNSLSEKVAGSLKAMQRQIKDKDARIAELEKALRAAHACCCRECAREIERLLPDTVVL